MTASVSIRIEERDAFADGQHFGETGAYERVKGTVSYRLDPEQGAMRAIVDTDRIRRDADGLVSFSAQFFLLRPKSLSAGNGRLLYEVNNRGNKQALYAFNDASFELDGAYGNDPRGARHAGNGFLMRKGYTILWSGWQGDLVPGKGRLLIDLPALEDGDEITGRVRSELLVEDDGIDHLPLSGNEAIQSYEALSLDQQDAILTCRPNAFEEPVTLSKENWSFEAKDADGSWRPSARHCRVKSGFRPGWLYEIIYTAKNPRPLGLGFIAVQELISFLMYEDVDREGRPNPLREGDFKVEKAYAYGSSQSGRFLREFVYRGYNADRFNRQVFQGVMLHAAGAGRVTLNYRFAQPGRHPRQHQDRLYASDEFPFAYALSTDHLTGRSDGILKRPDTDPLLLHTQGSAEYWERRGSLVHTDSRGNDLSEPEKARVYCFASAPHSTRPWFEVSDSNMRYPRNTLQTSAIMRALLAVLDDWATHGTLPPPSRGPSRKDGTGVSFADCMAKMPAIPGLSFPVEENRLFLTDFGPQFENGIFVKEPPEADRSKEYGLLLPAVDEDGLEIAGVRTPHISVPLATYLGWNLRYVSEGVETIPSVWGSVFPFPRNEIERAKTKDPRPSIAKRYPTEDDYIGKIREAAMQLMRQRLMLEEDVSRYVAHAAAAMSSLPAAQAIAEPQLFWNVAGNSRWHRPTTS